MPAIAATLPSFAGGQAPTPRANSVSDIDRIAEELTTAQRAGIACIVDAGHPDTGRDINFLRQVAMKSGMPIVASAGFYAQPFHPKEVSTMSEDQIVQALVKQVDEDSSGAFGEIGRFLACVPRQSREL